MSSYLELARRARVRRNEPRSRPSNEAVTYIQAIREHRSIHLDSEGRKLEVAGFKPKERGGKIIWQRPDTGLWVSQEMALHLLESMSMEEDQR